MGGCVLWTTVVCATLSALSAAAAIGFLATDKTTEHRFAKIWLFLHLITASLAATYYSKVVRWQKVARLRQYHDNFLWLSRALGVPLMAAHITENTMALPDASQVLAGVGISVFAVGCWAVRHRQLATGVANGLVLSVMAVLCCLHRSPWGVAWVVLLSLALFTGTHGAPLTVGQRVTIARIDVTHLLLGCVNVALVMTGVSV